MVHEQVEPGPDPTGFLKIILPKKSGIKNVILPKVPTAVPKRRHHLQEPQLIADTSNLKDADIYSHRYSLESTERVKIIVNNCRLLYLCLFC